jgi:DNA-binding GntR family transcriptional regulator
MSHSPLALKIANSIIADINLGKINSGDHLATDALAQIHVVSRSPVRQALEALVERGVIEKIDNRGFFVLQRQQLVTPLETPNDPYMQFALDWLDDKIANEVTELSLRERYKITKTQAQELISRAAREGWAEPKAGYGWILRPVAKTHEAFEQIYRFRAVIEPAALLEASFNFNKSTYEALKGEQSMILDANIDSLPQGYTSCLGIKFHEELIKMSGNPLYLQALERSNQLRKLLEYRLKPNKSRILQQVTDHLELLELLARGENLEAAHFMKRHVLASLTRKTELFS